MSDTIEHISFLDIKDRKVLMCLSSGKTKWQLPGGKKEQNETDQETLIRECKEELDINIRPNSIKHFKTIEGQAHGKAEGVIVRVMIYLADFDGEIKPSSEIQAASYMKLSEVPDTSETGWIFLKELNFQGLID